MGSEALNPEVPEPNEAEACLLLDDDNPWPGLLAYREANASFFHGRDAEAEQLFRRVLQKNLTLLFGQSGLGKTSLVNARLYPRLRAEGFLPIDLRFDFRLSDSLRVQTIRQITSVLESKLPGARPPDPRQPLWNWFHLRNPALLRANGTPVVPVLVFDQFEELFTVGAEGDDNRLRSADFLAEIADAVENRPPVALTAEEMRSYDFKRTDFRVVLSMREDFIAHLDSHSDRMPSIGENRMRLTPLNGRQALNAVIGPGRRLVSPAVARKIVRFVAAGRRGRDTAAPISGEGWRDDLETLIVDCSLLNLVCRELNRLRQDRKLPEITSELVAETGELQTILRWFYDDCVRDLPSAVPEFIERELVTDTGFRDSVSEERAQRLIREAGSDPVALGLLVQRRLLRVEERLAQRRVELAHDVLCAPVRGAGAEREAAAEKKRADDEIAEIRKARQVEEEKCQEEERKRRAAERMTLAMVVLFVLALIGGAIGYWGWVSADKAKKDAVNAWAKADSAEKQAKTEARIAEEQRAVASLTAARADFDLATLLLEGESPDVPRAVAHLCRALRARPDHSPSSWRLQSLLREAAWHFSNRPSISLTNEIISAAFCAEGPRLVTILEDRRREAAQLQVWDATSGQRVGVPFGDAGSILWARLSPDGSRCVTFSLVPESQFMALRVWDIASGERIAQSQAHGVYHVSSAAFSPDGRRIVTASHDKTAQVWDAQTGQIIGKPLTHESYVESATFSPDGRRIVSASANNTAQVWDVESGRKIGPPLTHEDIISSASFSPDGRRIVISSHDWNVYIWDAESGRIMGGYRVHGGPVYSAIFTPDGRRVVAVSDASNQYGYSIREVEILNVVFEESMGESRRKKTKLNSANLSPDGRSILTVSANNIAQVWDAGVWQSANASFLPDGVVQCVVADPDGRLFVIASGNPGVQVWSADLGLKTGQLIPATNAIYSAAISPNGGRVLLFPNPNSAQVWDTASGHRIGPTLQFNEGINSVNFSPDGRRFVTASDDKTARIWDAESGQKTGPPLKHTGSVHWASFFPDGRRVATSSERSVLVWDLDSGQLVGRPLDHQAAVSSIACSPDGHRIVTAANDNAVQVWDMESGQRVGQPMQHYNSVSSARFSPDGRRIVTASDNWTARVWDAESGQPVGEPFVHAASVHLAGFSADGRRILTTCFSPLASPWQALQNATGPSPVFLENPPSPAIQRYEVVSADGPVPEGFIDLAERMNGARFDANGVLAPVTDDPAKSPIITSSSKPEWVRFADWLLQRGPKRMISPNSTLRIDDWLEVVLKTENPKDLDQAERLLPGDPLVLAARAGQIASLGRENRDKPIVDDARMDAADAAFLCRYAAEHAGVNAEDENEQAVRPRQAKVFFYIARAWQRLGKHAEAMTAIEQAIHLHQDQPDYLRFKASLAANPKP